MNLRQISFFTFLLLFSRPGFADTCSCNGLAANFPGFSLICGGRVIDRTPFIDGDVGLASQVCEADRSEHLGAHHETDLDCICDDPSQGQVLLEMFQSDANGGKHFGLHRYGYSSIPGSIQEALEQCDAQRKELIRVHLCYGNL